MVFILLESSVYCRLCTLFLWVCVLFVVLKMVCGCQGVDLPYSLSRRCKHAFEWKYDCLFWFLEPIILWTMSSIFSVIKMWDSCLFHSVWNSFFFKIRDKVLVIVSCCLCDPASSNETFLFCPHLSWFDD